MKFIIVKTDLFINNKLYPEGSEIDLSKEQSKGIQEFLQPCHPVPTEGSPELTEGHPEQSEGSQNIVSKIKLKGNKK